MSPEEMSLANVPPPSRFTLALSDVRQQCGYGQEEVAMRVGVPPPAYLYLEHGCATPSHEVMETIRDVLGIDTPSEELLVLDTHQQPEIGSAINYLDDFLRGGLPGDPRVWGDVLFPLPFDFGEASRIIDTARLALQGRYWTGKPGCGPDVFLCAVQEIIPLEDRAVIAALIRSGRTPEEIRGAGEAMVTLVAAMEASQQGHDFAHVLLEMMTTLDPDVLEMGLQHWHVAVRGMALGNSHLGMTAARKALEREPTLSEDHAVRVQDASALLYYPETSQDTGERRYGPEIARVGQMLDLPHSFPPDAQTQIS